MKHTFKYILFAFAILAPVVASAQTVTDEYKNENGVATGKQVIGPNSDGSYTITLETFATGESFTQNVAIPSDIVLVLDVSDSMSAEYETFTAVSRPNGGWNASNVQGLFYQYSGSETRYAPVRIQGNQFQYYQRGVWVTVNNYNGNQGVRTLYRGGSRRIDELVNSVKAFIDQIYANNGTLPLQQGETGNQVAIVSFAEEANILRGFTAVDSESNVNSLKDAADGLFDLLRSRTAPDLGMDKAESEINRIHSTLPAFVEKDGELEQVRSKTVVLFTDGEPSRAEMTTVAVSNDCISTSYDLKQGVDLVRVFTVGLFTNPSTDVIKYMEYTSSDYPTASSLTDPGTDGQDNNGYYHLVSSDTGLNDIFKTIAEQSGGSTKTIPATTQVRDVVSSSFNLPAGFNANSVVVYTVDVKEDGLDWYEVPAHTVPTPPTTTAHVQPLTVVTDATVAEQDETKIAVITSADRLTIQGFDYSKPDGDDLGSGNWVGKRITGETYKFYGKKLVVEFNIRPESEATGGNATNTNADGSGVYILDKNGNYVSINDYEKPHTDLPTVLKISKKGLKRGDSATFQIVRYRPIGWNPEDPKDVSNYQWTVVGKPQPDPATKEDFSKVILTNKNGDESTEIVKTLMALDPSWIYEVFEDDWAWSYTYDGSVSMTTSDVEVNPFRFTNKKNADAVKHAEAVSVNHFANNKIGLESNVENIKSNETFTPNNSSSKSK